ncbi:MAG: hypothetical protein ACXWQO_20170 [Bdellovibrionota bacterium]
MKLFYSVLVLIPTLAIAAPCVDLSGDYFVPSNRLPESRAVVTIRQAACDTISGGGYSIENGQPTHVINPRLMYVNEAKRQLCPACVGFSVAGDSLEIKANGQLEVNKGHCDYNKVRWGLKAKNMFQTYFLTGGGSSGCKRLGSTYTKTFDRYR